MFRNTFIAKVVLGPPEPEEMNGWTVGSFFRVNVSEKTFTFIQAYLLSHIDKVLFPGKLGTNSINAHVYGEEKVWNKGVFQCMLSYFKKS